MGKSDSVDIEVYYCNHLILKYNGSSPSIIFQHHPCVFTILGFLHCRRGHKQGLALGSIDFEKFIEIEGTDAFLLFLTFLCRRSEYFWTIIVWLQNCSKCSNFTLFFLPLLLFDTWIWLDHVNVAFHSLGMSTLFFSLLPRFKLTEKVQFTLLNYS